MDQELWNLIWKIEIPEKIRILLWRISRNILPIATRLTQKGVQIDETCVMCHEEAENPTYCLFKCIYAQEVWRNSPIAMDVDQWPDIEGKDAVLLGLHTIGKPLHGLFAAICWSIWLARNDRVWNNKTPRVEAIFNQAVSLFTSYEKANEDLRGWRQQMPPGNIRWSPPEENWIKMNVDGAQSNLGDKAGVGTILRSCDGNSVAAMAVDLEKGGEALLLELRALREALNWTLVYFRGSLIVEMDCLEAIQALKAEHCEWRTEEATLIQECKQTTTQFQQVRFSHTKREGNCVAHALAKRSMQRRGREEWFEALP